MVYYEGYTPAMKAAIVYGPRDVRVETVEDPSPRDDEILVKVRTCGICGTDAHTYKTGGTASPQKPVILGHEFSGEVAEVGRAIKGLKAGDRVLGTGYRNCGDCYWCRQGQPYRCPNPTVPGEGLPGAFAEYVIIPNPMLGMMLFHLPEGMDWEEAATVEPLAVACHAVRRARIQAGETVVVLGAGMIGQLVAQACRAAGASRIIVSEPSATRLAMASKLGADVAINPREKDPVEAVREATAQQMADVVFECSGAPAAFGQAGHMVRAYGRIMQVGMFEQDLQLSPELMSLMFQFRNVTLRGCGGQRWDMALDLMRAGQVRTTDLITHRFPLNQVREAFNAQLNSDDAIKVLVKP
ncbi:MAG: alcohol dehydrogenase [Chloroflexi bacterium]|nr:MAG: alcohol dehydrogenase [Chloroflexota bacterium]